MASVIIWIQSESIRTHTMVATQCINTDMITSINLFWTFIYIYNIKWYPKSKLAKSPHHTWTKCAACKLISIVTGAKETRFSISTNMFTTSIICFTFNNVYIGKSITLCEILKKILQFIKNLCTKTGLNVYTARVHRMPKTIVSKGKIRDSSLNMH